MGNRNKLCCLPCMYCTGVKNAHSPLLQMIQKLTVDLIWLFHALLAHDCMTDVTTYMKLLYVNCVFMYSATPD